ncbi:MAG: peptidylprolyl isomerase [Clostridia bacterium]|nr:peptidylprolyl isomerase [Clostridia bacterium]
MPLLPEDLKNDIRPVVTITMTDNQEIKIMLVPEIAPNTVNNFISLIESGYYDGLTFHRIIKNFMIQGGDPLGTGAGGPGYTIKDEFYVYDKEKNTVIFLPHYRGVVSMAKKMSPDTAGSQFFIVHQDAHHLNGQYAAFGFVVEGMEVVDALSEVKTGANDKPLEDVLIKNITVELNGYNYSAPQIIQ